MINVTNVLLFASPTSFTLRAHTHKKHIYISMNLSIHLSIYIYIYIYMHIYIYIFTRLPLVVMTVTSLFIPTLWSNDLSFLRQHPPPHFLLFSFVIERLVINLNAVKTAVKHIYGALRKRDNITFLASRLPLVDTLITSFTHSTAGATRDNWIRAASISIWRNLGPGNCS